MSKLSFELTIYGRIFAKIDALEIGQTVNKKELIIELYGYFDEYVQNSFVIHLMKAKRYDVSKKYKSRYGLITRTS